MSKNITVKKVSRFLESVLKNSKNLITFGQVKIHYNREKEKSHARKDENLRQKAKGRYCA